VGPGGDLAGQAGFAIGAPRPSAHAQAIRSLLAGAGTARLYVADIYGSDPAGGNALAIARALGWMIRQGVPVVSISLVGPANPLVRRAVELARAKGLVVVAAVGNDGPAAPAAYPASYPGVIAVTGVDRQNRVLFEAGKAAHLDYAAPGADLTAIGLDGRRVALRGTSFAAPLAASRIAAHRVKQDSQLSTFQAVDAEAQVRGPRVGRGILCAGCRSGT
jgi:subtilisin family serine protease